MVEKSLASVFIVCNNKRTGKHVFVMAPRKSLTLKEKVDMIDYHRREKCGVRKLSEVFKIGKTQAAEIVKKQDELLRDWHLNGNEQRIRQFQSGSGALINKAVIEWFSRIRSQNVPVSGPMIQAKALEFAAELGDSEFKASNGWLEKFRKRHDIKFRSICGESSSVDMETVTNWEEKLPSLISGYSPENIFNADETGLFFRALPDKTLCFKGQSCAGGKVAKERLTVLLCASMSGEREKPLVIGKSLKPRCFKNMDVTKFGVDWKANRKAWMTREIMTEWLEQLDRKMMRQNRKVLLFLDNATSHPDIKLNNVKVMFFPPNVTSLSQPLDQGVIQNFKVKYRQLVLKHIVSRLDEDGTSLQSLTKELNVFQAICWITNAWKQVSTTTIQSCFRKAGFPAGNGEMNVESDISDEMNTTQNLINSAGYTIGVNDYVCIDLDILTECSSEDAKMILQSIQENENGDDDNHDSDDDDDVGGDVEIVNNSDVPPIMSYSEALDCVKRLKQFYSAKEDENGLRMVQDLIIHNESITVKPKCTKQTNIASFFFLKK